MAVMSAATIHERCHKLSHRIQIHYITRRAALVVQQHTLEQAAQAHRVRGLGNVRAVITERDVAIDRHRSITSINHHVNIDLDIVSTNLLIPQESYLTILAKARIPLADSILEISPELNLLRLFRYMLRRMCPQRRLFPWHAFRRRARSFFTRNGSAGAAAS
jgi:hypothetical protein